MSIWDFLLHPAGPPRGWSNLPAIPERKGVTFNGAEYVPPLVSGPGASAILEAMGAGNRPDGNSAVFACLMALSMAFFEPPVRVYRTDRDGNAEAIAEHPLQAILDRPNPWMSAAELWFWAAWALNCDGNAYLEKVRAGNADRGNVIELWPRSPLLMAPFTARGSGDFITHYRLQIGPGRWREIPIENVVHLRLGFDDRDQRVGVSGIKRLIRHISSDDEASRFAGTLLGNYGLPGLVVNMPGSAVTKEEADEIKAKVSASFGSDNRGNVSVLYDGAKMEQFGFSPEQLNLKALHQIPETRIAAVMQVPPAVAGLSVGLEQTSNFASFAQVREQFVENTMAPRWRMRDDKLNAQLLPDFASDRAISVRTDLSEVRALQDDQNALHERAAKALTSGGVTLNQYLEMIGRPPDPNGDVRYVPVNVTVTPIAELGVQPEPAPADQQASVSGEPALRVVGGGG